MFTLCVDASDIGSNDTQTDEQAPTNEPNRQHDGSPTLDTPTINQRDNHIDQNRQTDEQEEDAQVKDETQRPYTERCNPIDGKRQHLAEGIFALVALPLQPVIKPDGSST